MKQFDKLVVAGCSVSDRGNVNFCYGDKLAELLNCEYDHQGAGCGSNYRIWRVVTQKVLNGEITPNTLLVIQYTEPTRKEFWSQHVSLNYDEMYYKTRDVQGHVQLREPFHDGGELIRYKLTSDAWQPNKYDRAFFKMYEEDHVNGEYDLELFKTNHFNFVNMLRAQKIPVVFFSAWNYAPYKFLWFPEGTEIFKIDNTIVSEDLKYDSSHFNDQGHEFVAKLLYDFIQNQKSR